MKKLNIGCGDRFAQGWVNIDFHSSDPGVTRVNILGTLPYPDATFDAVYSSHVLEHFSRDTASRLLKEQWRVLKPGGIVRVVVPDLEAGCREYIRILDSLPHSPLDRRKYDWIILELIDQLTRTRPSGLMQPFMMDLIAKGDQEMLDYVQSRTQNTPLPDYHPPSVKSRFQQVTVPKVINKFIYLYIAFIKKLLPSHLRETIIDDSRIGEKHRWMYDRHGMTLKLEECGFVNIRFLSAAQSQIPNFAADHLDTLPDGRPYKPISLFAEATKP